MMLMRALQGILALCLVGCVHPVDDSPAFPGHPGDFDIPSQPASEQPPAPPAYAADDIPPPAPRLRRSKTLGESTYDRGSVAQAPGAGPGPAQGGTTVIIHNNVQQSAASVVYPNAVPGLNFAPVYGGTGASNARGGSGSGAGSVGRTPPVGGDWPQVPSYGPR